MLPLNNLHVGVRYLADVLDGTAVLSRPHAVAVALTVASAVIEQRLRTPLKRRGPRRVRMGRIMLAERLRKLLTVEDPAAWPAWLGPELLRRAQLWLEGC